ncbi:MAG: histidine kinase [Acidiphilium sp. 21-60-14]|nr:MAG: histidine kinase [Acidiphilium sp. 21-60-14]
MLARILVLRVIAVRIPVKATGTAGKPALASGFAVVAAGASAGGLEAFGRMLDHLPTPSGLALILVQHLDPTHVSLMANLLARHTVLPIVEAAEGMMIEAGHVYVIPPGRYLTVERGALRVRLPSDPHGMRLPFDVFLHSLAMDYGARAVAVVLSGTGSDGSGGLRAVKDQGGYVIAQAPEEAQFDGMPQSAIATGLVDAVLPLAAIGPALMQHRPGATPASAGTSSPDDLSPIIELLRERTAHDFSLYKSGTLMRRIERRMGMAGVNSPTIADYAKSLADDPDELEALAKDFLINVTGFFRDKPVFDVLESQIIPTLVATHVAHQPLRIWIAGCSTGEETYSLAMLLVEHIRAIGAPIKVQIFASDVDQDAIAQARAGLYKATIEAEVSAERRERFFTREDQNYRISAELRGMVVFTVQDVLADPPFSRLDFVSCRNLLIYLRPEAQAKIIALFHFALRDGGFLLLGSSETLGAGEHGFDAVAKAERIYRRSGRSRPGVPGVPMLPGERGRAQLRAGGPLTVTGTAPVAELGLGELCRRLVLEAFAPAAMLINRHNESLYTLGPIDQFLQIAPGAASHDVLAMARPALRAKLRAAIRRANDSQSRVVVAGEAIDQGGAAPSYSIDVRPVPGPVPGEGDGLLLICFVPTPTQAPKLKGPGRSHRGESETLQIQALERELAATRSELLDAIHDLELSSEDQKAINEEALSVNEEFQSTNEELVTSKEELQSLNEELTALNGQLQEALERQRTTANDLQNILYSTDFATLFLDVELKIRFFTPATRVLFTVIPSDIGRPLADLATLTSDGRLAEDARLVLETLQPIEREVQSQSGAWFTRRVLPYRTQQRGVEGVVITFIDVSERKRIAAELVAATTQAEQSNLAKSRFLASASHDLRQPLAALALQHGLLMRAVAGGSAAPLVERMGQSLSVMTGMLDTLLDINEIEAGVVKLASSQFSVNAVFDRLRQEFGDDARARGLELRVMPCSVTIETDRQRLMQILRNLVSNAMKYTRKGCILVGARRDGDRVRLEVWDTGIGIPADEFQSIFEEYHQLDNPARDRTLGLGLGLAVVRRLTDLLSLPVQVRSRQGSGSVFSISVPISVSLSFPSASLPLAPDAVAVPALPMPGGEKYVALILVIEDDPDLRDLFEMAMVGEGHRVVAVGDGAAAVAAVGAGAWPDLVLSDYNLPHRMNGIEAVRALRATIGRKVPAIILTGDILADVVAVIEAEGCSHFSKPVSLDMLTGAVARALPVGAVRAPVSPTRSTRLMVIDDDAPVRAALREVLSADGWRMADFESAEAFLAAYQPGGDYCLLIDVMLPGLNGLDLLRRLRGAGDMVPAVMLTGVSDAMVAVAALQAGAADFIEKPVNPDDLLARIARAVEAGHDHSGRLAVHMAAVKRLSELTPRQRDVLDVLLEGHSSKVIAHRLGISARTVEVHRAAIMQKTGATSMAALTRLAVEAAATTD